MSKKQDIIHDLEMEYGVELDSNFDPGVLCDGDSCRHDECSCWESFTEAVENQLDKQKTEEMQKLYQAEVGAGIHTSMYKDAGHVNFRGED
jgi:hypothetical protein